MYTFPGVWPFIERIALETGRDLHQAGRTRQLWHVTQIQDALGQLPRLDPVSRIACLARVATIRDSLALALEGVDAAIVEAAQATEPLPSTDTPSKKRRA